MAARKMTFTFPEDAANSFLRAVGSSRRSKFVVEAVEAKLRERDQLLIEACQTANDDPETRQIEREMASLPDTMTEAWDESDLSPSR